MSKKLLITIFLSGVAAIAVAMTPVERQIALKRAYELYDYDRLSDARSEFMRVLHAVVPAEEGLRQEVESRVAMCAVEQSDEAAELQLTAFLRKYPSSVYANDVRFALGLYYCAAENLPKAKECFAKTSYRALRKSDRERYDVRMGYISFVDKQYAEAQSYFNRIPAKSPYYDHAVYYKSYMAYHNGDYRTAKTGFESLQRSDAYAPVVPFYLVQIEFKQGNYSYVTRVGEQLLPKAPQNERARLQRVLSEAWYRQENYPKAAAYITSYGKSGGEMGRDEQYILGYSLYRSADYVGAQSALQSACGADDALTQNASYHLADCYLRNGNKAAAKKAFALSSNASFDAAIAEDALFNYGKLAFELNDGAFNEAINTLTRYIAAYPSSPRVSEAEELLIAAYCNSRNYAQAYDALKTYPSPNAELRAALQKIAYFKALEEFRQGNAQRAEALLQESAAIGVSPKYTALAAFWQGEIAYSQGNTKRAAERYNFYLRRSPKTENEYRMALYGLGYAYLDGSDFEQAQKFFDGFLWLHKSHDAYRADALCRRGDALYSQRKFDDAARSYADAASYGGVNRDYADFQTAMIAGLRGDVQTKQRSLAAIAEQSENRYARKALSELGHTYITEKEYAEGAKALERYNERYPDADDSADVLSELGLAYFNTGDTARSLEYYNKVISRAPRSQQAKEALHSVREIYVGRGDADGYFAYAERAGVECDLSRMTRDSLSFRSAEKLYLDGKDAEAVEPLRRYIADYPKGYYLSDALYCLSDCYLKQNSTSEAIDVLRNLIEQPVGQYTVGALARYAQLTFDEGQYATSAAAYRRLYDVALDAAARGAAAEGYATSVLAQNDAAQSVKLADELSLMTDTAPATLRTAQFAKAGVLATEGKHSEALKIYTVLSADVSDSEGAESAYRVIESEYAAAAYDKAEKSVFALSKKNTPYNYWLGRAFIILGDVYVQKGDTFQARATYQSIVDGYSPADDGVVAEAKARIANLK